MATHFRAVHSLFGRLPQYSHSDSGLLINLIDHLVYPFVAKVLVKTRLIASALETSSGIVWSKGVLPITYVRGYFQDLNDLNPSRMRFAIEERYYRAARGMLAEAGNRTPIFVHVRRGDYSEFRILDGSSPLLPASYYNSGIQRLLREVPSPHFFFLGDDPEWCTREFAWVRNKSVSRLSPYEDLALMSLCAGGVISNSTFAWWGAFRSRKTVAVIAPLYWLGWRSGAWYPEGMKYDGFEYAEVAPIGMAR